MNIIKKDLRISKKCIILIGTIFIAIFINTQVTYAKPPDFNGGVLNETIYEEVFFLTGQPIMFTGKAVVTERETKDKLTSTYTFTLESPAKDKLTRNIVYEADLIKREDKGQTTSNTKVKSFNEKITMANRDTYTLNSYQFTQAAVADNRPASDYYSGNMIGKKVYKLNRDEFITVEASGRNMGYKNFWGATETQLIDYEISSKLGKSFVTSKVSDSKSRILKYEPHDPSLSSFTGGHIVISASNMVGEYTYNIPFGRGKGTIQLSKEGFPFIDRLIVPKFRDLSNHWAKDQIERLYSLGILEEQTQFFSPNTPMNRYQYAVGVLKAVNLRVAESPKNNKVAKKTIFKDLDAKDPNYLYLESGIEKKVISGITNELFMPNSPITREQAVTILVRALGMEGRAPSPGFTTGFADDNKIQKWAKDSVYVATELGLIYGDTQNRFNPSQHLTRAEGSALIVRFLDFLENDLKQNYRDDILFFN